MVRPTRAIVPKVTLTSPCHIVCNLNGLKTREMMKQLYGFFESKVELPRIRVGKRQTIETLISEEALLFAKFLRDERKTWTPRIAVCRSMTNSYPMASS
jgi:hypothetical protein